jgi:hypothetical protein
MKSMLKIFSILCSIVIFHACKNGVSDLPSNPTFNEHVAAIIRIAPLVIEMAEQRRLILPITKKFGARRKQFEKLPKVVICHLGQPMPIILISKVRRF